MRFGHRPAPVEDQGGPLEEVLEAERSAASTVAAARRDADAWLAAEKLAIERERDSELASLDTWHLGDVATAQRAAATHADAIVAAAETGARELQALSDQDLLPIVARHLAAILPGDEP
jgi:hypothetical protein